MHLNFNPDQDIPDLTGKVFFITGGTSGLGTSTTLHLTKHNAARIYISGRNASSAEKVIATAHTLNPSVSVRFIKCDLASLPAVKAAAADFLSQESRLDVLICNAGIMATDPALTSDGFELQFATNHLGHAMLIRELLPLLQQRTAAGYSTTGTGTETETETGIGDARVINLSSQGYMMHPLDGIRFNELRTVQDHGLLWSFIRYGQSKLANVLYVRELARRYPDVTAVAIHPGVVRTEMVDSMGWVKRWFVYLTSWWKMVSVEEGAYNQVWAATTTKSRLVNGAYYEPVGKEGTLDKAARDGELARELWEWTEGVLTKF